MKLGLIVLYERKANRKRRCRQLINVSNWERKKNRERAENTPWITQLSHILYI